MTNGSSNRQKFGYLPHVLALLLPEIGEEGVVKLVAHFGGTKLYVASDLIVSRLSPVIGDDIAVKIREVLRQNIILSFDVPLLKDFNVLRRRKKIAEEYSSGVMVKVIARNFGMTERGVYRALKDLRDQGFDIPKIGIGITSTRSRERRKEEARQRHANGERVEDIASGLGVSPETVLGYLEDE